MTDDEMRELARDVAWDKPDAARRERVRAELLVAAGEGDGGRVVRRWPMIAVGFAAGVAAAAAAVAIVWGSHGGSSSTPAVAIAMPRVSIEASTSANFERGEDEVVHLHGGRVRLAGEHVRVAAGSAVVEGAAGVADEIEVVAERDALTEVAVTAGSARVVVSGRSVFLAAGQTWKAPIETAAVDVQPLRRLRLRLRHRHRLRLRLRRRRQRPRCRCRCRRGPRPRPR